MVAVEVRIQAEQAELGELARRNENHCKESGHSRAANATKEENFNATYFRVRDHHTLQWQE